MPASATPANDTDKNAGLRKSCEEAIEELKAARAYIKAQGVQIELGVKLDQIQAEIEAKLRRINDLSAAEINELKTAISRKEIAIGALENANEELRRSRFGYAVKVGFFALAAGAVFGAVVASR